MFVDTCRAFGCNSSGSYAGLEHYLPNLVAGASLLLDALNNLCYEPAESMVVILVDPDIDGYTSAAIIQRWVEAYVASTLSSFTNSSTVHIVTTISRTHGLTPEAVTWILNNRSKIRLVIIPDSGTNDVLFKLKIVAAGIDVLIIDHHESELRCAADYPMLESIAESAIACDKNATESLGPLYRLSFPYNSVEEDSKNSEPVFHFQNGLTEVVTSFQSDDKKLRTAKAVTVSAFVCGDKTITQLSENSNLKSLTGAGLVQLFLQYIDHQYNVEKTLPRLLISDKSFDLSAVGTLADQAKSQEPCVYYFLQRGFCQTNGTYGPNLGLLNQLINTYKIEYCVYDDGFTMLDLNGLSKYVLPKINSILRMGSLKDKQNLYAYFLQGKRTTLKVVQRSSVSLELDPVYFHLFGRFITLPPFESLPNFSKLSEATRNEQFILRKALWNKAKNYIIPNSLSLITLLPTNIMKSIGFRQQQKTNSICIIDDQEIYGKESMVLNVLSLLASDGTKKYNSPVAIGTYEIALNVLANSAKEGKEWPKQIIKAKYDNFIFCNTSGDKNMLSLADYIEKLSNHYSVKYSVRPAENETIFESLKALASEEKLAVEIRGHKYAFAMHGELDQIEAVTNIYNTRRRYN